MKNAKTNSNTPVIAVYHPLQVNGRIINILAPMNGDSSAITFEEISNAYGIPHNVLLDYFAMAFGVDYKLQKYQISNYQVVDGLNMKEFNILINFICEAQNAFYR